MAGLHLRLGLRVHLYLQYLRECLPLALRGSIRSTLTWAAILFAGMLGGLGQYFSGQLVFAEGRLSVALSAIASSVGMWILIVILKLFFVAPYELWKLNHRLEYKMKLQEFYVRATELLQRKLPVDLTDEEFESYVAETKQWVNETAHWIQDNISYHARVKFLDRTGVTPGQAPDQVNERHAKILANLLRFRMNLETLINTNVWQ
jgi:hypothetical protein